MKYLFTVVIAAALCSCSDAERYEKIAGKWECSSWINEVTGIDQCDNNVRFDFQLDKSYTSVLGAAQDSGTYRIQSNLLYVTPDDKLEFAVKITTLNPDTMVFLMNQAGNEEILTLVKSGG
jgi:hypothetical protein